MDWLTGFFLGFTADLFRSVFMPASTEWLNRFVPSARKKANIEENVLTLDIMEKLKSLGKDPHPAMHARDDAVHFLNVLTSQKEVFVENAIELLDSTYMTQIEMNAEALRRSNVARQHMERAKIAVERSGWLINSQLDALTKAQAQWEEYAKAQAEFAASNFEGGSMASLIYSSELESAIVIRTADLNRMLEELRERHAT